MRRPDRRRLGAWLGSLTFVALVVVALAGADRPPPPGFVVVVVAAAALGAIVSRSVPRALAEWDRVGTAGALCRVAGAGALVGVVAALGLMVVSPGEPTTVRSAADVLVWVVVLGVGGAVGAVSLLAAARALDRRA